MSLALSCAACGKPLLPTDRFCIQCGAAAGQRPPSDPGRDKPVPPSELLTRLRQATLGVYDIAGELGRGGMAVVYLAHEIALDRKVAIKALLSKFMADEDMVERFKRDARTAARLDHPNIVQMYRVEESAHLVYFVMKFVNGGALDTILLRAGPLPIPVAQTILTQLGGALAYAHRRGVVHRDVKPANVILDSEGWVIVTDFGIAKVAQERGLTVSGSCVGTPSYMSPEQCLAREEVTGASDQYAFGIVAYEMLTGKPPFVADSDLGLLLAHMHEIPRPLRECRPDCPQSLSDGVMRMLEKKPEDRWPAMEDAVVAIGGASRARLGGDAESARIVKLARETGTRRGLTELTPVSPAPAGRISGGQRPGRRPG